MTSPHAPRFARFPRFVADVPIVIGLTTGAMVLAHLSPAAPAGSGVALLWSVWLIACIVACSFRAMTHADALAEKFGEPLGTLILTISAITIEVAAVCAIMLGSEGDTTVARDTMFAVIMVILNLLIGGAMLIGGLRRSEQEFNPQSAGSYLPLIVALVTITLVLPRLTTSEAGGWMSDPMELFVGVASLAIYGVFLWMQTTRHREFFANHGKTERESSDLREAISAHDPSLAVHHEPPTWLSTVLLIAALVAVVMIAEGLAGRVNTLLATFYIPKAIGGVFIAVLVLAPEGFAALRASGRDDMQRAINILLGSAVATIGLTVPAVMVIRWITGVSPELGLEPPFIALLAATVIVASINLVRGKVNAMQGFVHLLLFLAWIITILDQGAVPMSDS